VLFCEEPDTKRRRPLRAKLFRPLVHFCGDARRRQPVVWVSERFFEQLIWFPCTRRDSPAAPLCKAGENRIALGIIWQCIRFSALGEHYCSVQKQDMNVPREKNMHLAWNWAIRARACRNLSIQVQALEKLRALEAYLMGKNR